MTNKVKMNKNVWSAPYKNIQTRKRVMIILKYAQDILLNLDQDLTKNWNTQIKYS